VGWLVRRQKSSMARDHVGGIEEFGVVGVDQGAEGLGFGGGGGEEVVVGVIVPWRATGGGRIGGARVRRCF
jgi:hypothetical protein